MDLLETRRRKFNVEEYHRMGEVGILHEDDHVELIAGEILEMSPIGSRHAACVNRLNKLLVQRVGDATVVHIQNPVRLPNSSEPEPDLALLRLREDFYAEALPTPKDMLLLIEVSDTTLEFDRDVKIPLYARAGSPEVWEVDLVGEKMHVYSRSTGEFYGNTHSVGRGDLTAPWTLPDLVISVDEVLG